MADSPEWSLFAAAQTTHNLNMERIAVLTHSTALDLATLSSIAPGKSTSASTTVGGSAMSPTTVAANPGKRMSMAENCCCLGDTAF
ncbi:hypothetical protein BASA61_000174 [Batrachochytrium salamandrivorans]|nr:hypothetical protein BASA61_000174 [Batrachochytrium salamandrivorans]